MHALLAALALLSPAQPLTYHAKTIEISGYETRRGSVTVPAPPKTGFLTTMRAEVVDDHNRPVPQQVVMLHHVLFMNKGRFRGDRTSSDCRPDQPHEKFYGTGEEAQELVLPDGYGYRVRKGDVWKMSYMLMNHTAKAARVHLRYTMTISTAALKPVTPYWVTLACDEGKIFNIAGGGRPGSVDRRTRDWTVPKSGKIVAGMAHAHGGTLAVGLSRPRCGGSLLSSDPQYGAADDPIYNVSPVLHEPSPRSMSVATSAKGWAVKRGEKLRLTASYDDESPHVAVMGIMHVYIADGDPPATSCPAAPNDVEAHRLPFPGAPGRPRPPRVTVDLTERGADGAAQPITDVPGAFSRLGGDATVDVRDAAFSPRKLSVPAGATVSWRFDDKIQHDVTVVGGPRGFASNYTSGGVTYSRKLTVPGTYRIFCSLHPVDMNQVVEVRAAPN
jgi:plastocyanin